VCGKLAEHGRLRCWHVWVGAHRTGELCTRRFHLSLRGVYRRRRHSRWRAIARYGVIDSSQSLRCAGIFPLTLLSNANCASFRVSRCVGSWRAEGPRGSYHGHGCLEEDGGGERNNRWSRILNIVEMMSVNCSSSYVVVPTHYAIVSLLCLSVCLYCSISGLSVSEQHYVRSLA
jgi:hypothetical protein